MGFIKIDDDMVKIENISSTDKIIYGIIRSLACQTGYCYASNGAIADKTPFKKRTISKSISSLNKANYIRIESIDYQRRIYPNESV